jgi:hypothetical protein
MHARIAVMVLLALAAGVPARGAVRVDQDEVIFTLRAPGAAEVYLVGDFNQWNPTVEPMNRSGDQFEIGLFLVAGDYRYQFVVDGRAVNDPDNPAPKGQRGSPLILVERGNGLVLSTEVTGSTGPVARAQPGLRYIGAVRSRDETTDFHRVDLTVRGAYERLRARAAVASEDSSWSSDPLSVDVWFDRGRIDVGMGALSAEAFENDSTWTSLDPTALVGNAGVYHYNAGYRRHAVGGTLATSKITVRAFYGDETGRAPAAGATAPSAAVDSFLAGTAPDTSVYAARYTFDASDALAFEAALDAGATEGGFVFRRDAGTSPGVAARLDRAGPLAVATTYATRENRAVSSVWLRRSHLLGARVSGAYGWGSIESHARAAGLDSLAPGQTIGAAGATSETDRTFPLLDTRRGLLEVGTSERAGWRGFARWDFMRFDVDGVYGRSRADVHRVTVSAADSLWGWGFELRARYTDADYGATPDALHVDWPELNPWLSIWDGFDPAGIAGLSFDRYDVVTLSAGRAWARFSARGDVVTGMRGVADEIVHAAGRVHAEARVHGPWYASADARTAWYDSPAWTSDGALGSGYIEAMYRRGAVELSAGFGFDPLVFDPVTSEYADIGYTEYLRGAALNRGVRRSRADDIVRALVAGERSLEDAGVFKLELVVDLR